MFANSALLFNNNNESEALLLKLRHNRGKLFNCTLFNKSKVDCNLKIAIY